MIDKNILVVGGAGFIGSHLCEILLKKQAKVFVIDDFSLGKFQNIPPAVEDICMVDASNYTELNRYFKEQKRHWDLVYNLAVVPLPHSLEDPWQNIEINIAIVQNLCELQRHKYFDKMVHFSSSEVYGTCVRAPMGEDHPMNPSTPYAAAKAAGDFICLSYVNTFGNKIAIARPFNTYGPRQNAGSYAGVIPLTIKSIINMDPPIIYGDGLQTRDYTYVTDVVQGSYMLGQRLLEYPKNIVGEVYNIASGHDIEIGWLVKTIIDIMVKKGFCDLPVVYKDDRPGDVRRHIANVLKAKDEIGFGHKIGMQAGLEKTVQWYLTERGSK